MKTGLLQVAIIDPATDDHVIITRPYPDTELTPELIQTETATGSIFGGKDWTPVIVFGSVDDEVLTQLEEWIDEQTPLLFVALFVQSVLFWNVPTALSQANSDLQSNARDGVQSSRVQFTAIAPDPDVYHNQNLLKAILHRNADGRTQPTDGSYTPLRADSGTASNFGTTASNIVTEEVYFPFEGVQLAHNGNITLTDSTDTLVANDSTGSIVTPSGTYKLQSDFNGESYLRVDGINRFTDE
jgi:hypothetical protein